MTRPSHGWGRGFNSHSLYFYWELKCYGMGHDAVITPEGGSDTLECADRFWYCIRSIVCLFGIFNRLIWGNEICMQGWSSWLWRGFNTAEVVGSIPIPCNFAQKTNILWKHIHLHLVCLLGWSVWLFWLVICLFVRLSFCLQLPYSILEMVRPGPFPSRYVLAKCTQKQPGFCPDKPLYYVISLLHCAMITELLQLHPKNQYILQMHMWLSGSTLVVWWWFQCHCHVQQGHLLELVNISHQSSKSGELICPHTRVGEH